MDTIIDEGARTPTLQSMPHRVLDTQNIDMQYEADKKEHSEVFADVLKELPNRAGYMEMKRQFKERLAQSNSNVELEWHQDALMGLGSVNEKCFIEAIRVHRETGQRDEETVKLRIRSLTRTRSEHPETKEISRVVVLDCVLQGQESIQVPLVCRFPVPEGTRPLFGTWDGPDHMLGWELPEKYNDFEALERDLYEASAAAQQNSKQLLIKDKDEDEAITNDHHDV